MTNSTNPFSPPSRPCRSQATVTKHAPPPTKMHMAPSVGVWAAAALPMALLAWVIAPAIADHLSGPSALSCALIVTLTAGLVWQFVLVLGLVRREQGTLRWSVVRDARRLAFRCCVKPGVGARVVAGLVIAVFAVIGVAGAGEVAGQVGRLMRRRRAAGF